MKNKQLQIIKGDITTLPVECIVNAANQYLVPGGGVCGAIYKKAGAELVEESKQYPEIAIGSAIATGGYDLCDYIVHAVGPIYHNHSPQEAKTLLESAYVESLILAEELKIKTIAFPLISAGIYGYPKEEAMDVALSVLNKAADYGNFDTVTLVLFFEEEFQTALIKQKVIEITLGE